MTLFSIIIFLIFIMILICSIQKKNKKSYLYKFFIIISFLILVIVSGCRGLAVGTDTTMFVRAFSRISGFTSLFSIYQNRFEVGYLIYNYLIKLFFKSPHALLLISSIITIFIFYKFFYKNSISPLFSIFLFVGLMYYCNSMCLLRQYIAIALSCIAISCLSENKNIKFLIFVILATLFHSTSLVLLVLFPLSKIKITENNKKKLIIISFFAVLFSSQILLVLIKLFPQYVTYLDSDKYYLENQLGTILKAILQFIIFLFINYNYKFSKDNKTDFNKIGYLCSLLAFCISIVSIRGSILGRMALYFSVINCVTLPNMIYKVNTSKSRLLVFMLASIIVFVYYYVILIFRPYWSGVIPYTFWN